MVVIEPVRARSDDTWAAVHSGIVRPSQTCDICPAGELILIVNPRHVPGAHAALPCKETRSFLDATGLRCTPGQNHHVPLADLPDLTLQGALRVRQQGGETVESGAGHRTGRFSAALLLALAAAKGTDASHIRIAIR